MAHLTLTIPEAAEALNAPKATIERVANDLGLLIYFGNRKRIDPKDLPELVNACRNTPKDRASTAARTRECGSSATPGGATAQQVLETAEKLKRLSANTCQTGTAPVVPLRQTR